MKLSSDIAGRHRRAILAAGVILWVGAMILTHIPAGEVPELGVSDKLAHAAGYFVLAAVFWLTLRAYEFRPRGRAPLVAMVAMAYATLDEATQPLFRRHAAVGDWLADVIGAVTALLVCELLARMIKPRSRRSANEGQ